jgi:hypothetical protein
MPFPTAGTESRSGCRGSRDAKSEDIERATLTTQGVSDDFVDKPSCASRLSIDSSGSRFSRAAVEMPISIAGEIGSVLASDRIPSTEPGDKAHCAVFAAIDSTGGRDGGGRDGGCAELRGPARADAGLEAGADAGVAVSAARDRKSDDRGIVRAGIEVTALPLVAPPGKFDDDKGFTHLS